MDQNRLIQADPNRPVTVVDFTAWSDLTDVIAAGKYLPDLKGATWNKVPDLLTKSKDAIEKIKNKPHKKGSVVVCSQCQAHFEIVNDSGDGILTNKKGTDTMNLEPIN